jgi:hypothetical protein
MQSLQVVAAGAQLIDPAGEFGDGVDAEFGGEMGAVEFDGALVDAERGGDLFVEQALHDEAEDFAFAAGEKIEGPAQGLKVCEAGLLLLVVGEGTLDGGEQVRLGCGFGEEILGSRAHRLDGGGDVALSC